jgi:cysteine desulfurase
MIYLDHAATTPVYPAALEAAWPYLTGEFGNASSTHELGHRASVALEDARERVARFIGARPTEVVFTSGGTESDNLGVIGLALATPRGKHIVSAKTEHEAVLESIAFLERVHGFTVTWLPVGKFGDIDLADVREALRPDTTLVTLMLSNNEIGAVHPVAEVAQAAHEVGALVHTDAVQALGWLPVNVIELGVDALSISGHKVGAPKGVGAFYLRSGVSAEPIMHGGGQEFELRSGTENVAWAVAFATALDAHAPSAEQAETTTQLRDAFITDVLHSIPRAALTGPARAGTTQRSPAIASFVFESVSGEAVLLQLEERGVIVSSGSACAAGSDDPSHVLLACGYSPELAQTSVRFSLSRHTTAAELSHAAAALRASVSALTGSTDQSRSVTRGAID